MAHLHSIYDTDLHFIIDPITRRITSESGKVTLMQKDHNSERFTFEIPRFVEGHDMSLTDQVQIHYINVEAASPKRQNKDTYPVVDLQVSPDSDDMVIFSWLISGNATQYVGSLNFIIRFVCYNGEEIVYQWWSDTYTQIKIASTFDNTNESVDLDDTDILESWRQQCIQAVYDSEIFSDLKIQGQGYVNQAKAYAEQAKKISGIDEVEDIVADMRSVINADISAPGWYRVAEYFAGTSVVGVQGAFGNSCDIFIKTSYRNTSTMVADIALESKYQYQDFHTRLSSSLTDRCVDKIRYVQDKTAVKAYLEIHYTKTVANVVSIELTRIHDSSGVYLWKTIAPVLTEETVDGLIISATHDIPKNASPVTDLDLNDLLHRYKPITSESLVLKTPILETAVSLPVGSYDYALGGTGYTGNDLPDSTYTYGTATINKRSTNSIFVVLWGHVAGTKVFPPIFNYYNGSAWSGWNIFATTADLAAIQTSMKLSDARNLISYPHYQTTRTINGITFTDNGDGTIHVSGTATASTSHALRATTENWTVGNGTYVLSGCPNGGSFSTYRLQVARFVDGTLTSYANEYGTGAVVEITDGLPMLIQIVIASGVTIDAIFKPMLERGSVVHDFVPYYYGGALDSDTVDGKHASDFLQSTKAIKDSEVDFNTFTTEGRWYIGSTNTLINAPTGAKMGWLEVTCSSETSSLTQTWTENTNTTSGSVSGSVWHRTKYGANWKNWFEHLHEGNFANYALPISGGGTVEFTKYDGFVVKRATTSNSAPTGIMFENSNGKIGMIGFRNGKLQRSEANGSTSYDILDTSNLQNHLTNVIVGSALMLNGFECYENIKTLAQGLPDYTKQYTVTTDFIADLPVHLPYTTRGVAEINKGAGDIEITFHSVEEFRSYTAYYNSSTDTWSDWQHTATNQDLWDYLPLSGGTISCTESTPLTLGHSDGTNSYIKFTGVDGDMGYIGFYGVDNPLIVSSNAKNSYSIHHDGNSAKVVVSSTPLTAEGSVRVW